MAQSSELSKSRKKTVKDIKMLDDYKQQCYEMIDMIERQFIEVNGFSIREVIYDYPNTRKRGYVISDKGEIIGDIIIYSTTYLNTDRSRAAREDSDKYGERHAEEPAIYVSSLDVIPSHRGKGIGLTLLFYGICKLYLVMFEDKVYAKFIKLNDASDNQTDVRGNIYGKIGVWHKGLIQFDDKTDRLTIDRIDADGEKVGRMETFFGSIPAYMSKYKLTHKQGGKYLPVKKTYRRKRSGKHKRNIKSRKHH